MCCIRQRHLIRCIADLTDPIDVYSEWVDETEAVNRAAIDEGNPEAAGLAGLSHLSGGHAPEDEEDLDQHDDEIARRQERHRNSTKSRDQRDRDQDEEDAEDDDPDADREAHESQAEEDD